MKTFMALLETEMKNLQVVKEMAVRAGTERKSFITRWDNASWESFYGDFDKMKSNSKKYTTKNEARIAAINLAQKKVEAKKSKISVDDALTGETIWRAGDMPLSAGEKEQIAKKPVTVKDPTAVKRSKDAPREFRFRLVSPKHDLSFLSPYDHPRYDMYISGFKKESEAQQIQKEVASMFSGYKASGSIVSPPANTVKISMPNVYQEDYYGTKETRKMSQDDASYQLKRMAKWTCDLLKKIYGNDIILTDFDKIESSDKTTVIAKNHASVKAGQDALKQSEKDEKGWTIYHSVGDYEHEGDIGRDYREILSAFKEAGISEKDVTWDREVEHGDGDNGDGWANIIIHGKGALLKKKVQDAIDSHF